MNSPVPEQLINQPRRSSRHFSLLIALLLVAGAMASLYMAWNNTYLRARIFGPEVGNQWVPLVGHAAAPGTAMGYQYCYDNGSPNMCETYFEPDFAKKVTLGFMLARYLGAGNVVPLYLCSPSKTPATGGFVFTTNGNECTLKSLKAHHLGYIFERAEDVPMYPAALIRCDKGKEGMYLTDDFTECPDGERLGYMASSGHADSRTFAAICQKVLPACTEQSSNPFCSTAAKVCSESPQLLTQLPSPVPQPSLVPTPTPDVVPPTPDPVPTAPVVTTTVVPLPTTTITPTSTPTAVPTPVATPTPSPTINPTATPTPTPTPPTAGAATVLGMGSVSGCAVEEGTLRCWGAPWLQLATGSADRSIAHPVSGLSSNVTDVTGGNDHHCAVQGGRVYCWGSNFFGQSGDGRPMPTEHQHLINEPIQVAGTDGIQSVDAGAAHTCAVTTGGGVQCWGNNYFGQLGLDSPSETSTAIDIPTLNSAVTAVSSGSFHTCAIHNGAAKCWGMNAYGLLGAGTNQAFTAGNATLLGSSTPQQVSGLDSGVTAIVAGTLHTCAIHNGAAKCWGDNSWGQLGVAPEQVGSRTQAEVVPGLESDVTAIAAVGNHTCALKSGQVFCWGADNAGQLGDGVDRSINTQKPSSPPVMVKELSAAVSDISVGTSHSCALDSGVLKCWGENIYQQLGQGENAPQKSLLPVMVKGFSSF